MTAENSYDAIPYPSGAYPQTHPDRLAVMATLYGMSPAPADRCRVLELGCGAGGNLIPLAYALPESTFLGVDLAGSAIAQGKDLIARAGLKNIAMVQADLLDYVPERGSFDYVIAHGLYAWVPPAVQDRVLAICGEALAPQGIAFVSYNAQPGSHVRLMIREMLQFHLAGVRDPKEQLASAKALLEVLQRSCPEPTSMQYYVSREAAATLSRERENLLHDELEENYRPAYFHEFAEHAGRQGLQYVSESEFSEMNPDLCVPSGKKVTWEFSPDQFLEREQYMDFLKCRTFRRTLLCRREATVRREVQRDRFDRLHIQTRAFLDASVREPEGPGSLLYRTPQGATMTSAHPEVHRLMSFLLQRHPWPVAFGDLPREGTTEAALRDLLLHLYGIGMLIYRIWVPPCARTLSERPVSSALARAQLKTQTIATSLTHTDMNFHETAMRSLIRLMDGTRTKQDLHRDLAAEGVTVSIEALEQTLDYLLRLSVLTG